MAPVNMCGLLGANGKGVQASSFERHRTFRGFLYLPGNRGLGMQPYALSSWAEHGIQYPLEFYAAQNRTLPAWQGEDPQKPSCSMDSGVSRRNRGRSPLGRPSQSRIGLDSELRKPRWWPVASVLGETRLCESSLCSTKRRHRKPKTQSP